MIEAKFEIGAFCTECKQEADLAVYIGENGRVTMLIRPCSCRKNPKRRKDQPCSSPSAQSAKS
jgi:hypothetical protein